jgi:C4-dicarboxylate transporter DctQ subunit
LEFGTWKLEFYLLGCFPPLADWKNIMKIINSINNTFAKIESILLIIILFSMILLAFLQVILRNFFSTSIFWGDTFLRHLVLWIAFIGASLATKENRHINIDVLSRSLPKSAKKVTGIIVNLFASTVCFFLLRAAITFLKYEKQSGSTLFKEIPVWIFQMIIAIGFGLMMLRFFIHALENVISKKSTNQEERA